MKESTELLKKIISINSIYPNEYELGIFLFDFLIKKGFKVKKHFISEKRFNILAEKGNSDISYLLYAHLDTVPIYGNWETNPFELVLSENKVFGLGSTDMKGGIVAIIRAVENFEPKNFKLKICFSVDEENFSEGAFSLSKTDWLDDVKGILVPESCLPYSKSNKAERFITIGRKGRCVFNIIIKGKSSHGAEKEKGINSIEEGALFLTKLKQLKFTENIKMGKTDFFARRFEGKTNSLSIPDYAEIELDFLIVPPDTSKLIKEKIEKFISELKLNNHLKADFIVKLSERPTPFLEPFELDEKNNFLQIAIKSMKKVYNEVFFNYGQSVADENVFGVLGIPTLTIGPLGDNHHSSNEWVDIKSLESLSDVYRDILFNLENI